MMTSTGRHLDETQAGIPNAPSERADLYGQSYCERHQGQQPKGRTQRPDIWAHRSRMGSAKKESILDRGVVPHMGIPLPYTWLNPSTRPRVWPRFGSPKGRQERDPHHDHQGHPTTPQAEQPCHQTRAQRQTPQSQKSGEVTRRASAANGRTTTATCTTGDRQSRRGGGRKVKFSSSDENCAYGGG
jgi:hypothetical protein